MYNEECTCQQTIRNRKQADGTTNQECYTRGNSTASLKLIVPEDEQQGLAEWQHHALLHASPAKVYAELQRHYHWVTMRKDIK